MREKWQRIIESRRDYDHPDYPISQWKRDALSGQTRKGYADCVSALLARRRAPIPEALKQFKPKGNFGKAAKYAVALSFKENGAIVVSKASDHGWFAMCEAFENLIPFVVAKGDGSFIVAKDTDEHRAELREMGAQVTYEWDGYGMIDYESM